MTTQTSHPAARRRYELEGPDAFGDIELLALLLGNTGTGTPAATQIAADLVQRFGNLPEIARLEPIELRRVRGIGRERSVRLHAALQLGRRALVHDLLSEPILTPTLAWDQFRPRLRGLVDEQLHAMFLDRRRRPLAIRCLTRGSDGFTVVDPRQIFRVAVALGASGIILAHNHPSGDPTPSEQDRTFTRRVARAGDLLGVRLLDHLIVGHDDYRSLAEDGLVEGILAPDFGDRHAF